MLKQLCGVAKVARNTGPVMTPCTAWSLENAAYRRHDLAELKPGARHAERAFLPRKKTAPQWNLDLPLQTQRNKTKQTASKAARPQQAVHPVDLQESGMRQPQCRGHLQEPNLLALPLLH